MKQKYLSLVFLTFFVGASHQDEPSPFLDMASEFLQATLANQNAGGGGGGGGIAGIAQVLGSLMQGGESGGKSNENGAAQVLAGLGSLLSSMNQDQPSGKRSNGGGFDPAMIMNVVSMFAGAMNQGGTQQRQKRGAASETPTMDAVLSIASSFLQNMNGANGRGNNRRGDDDDDETDENEGGGMGEAIMNMLPTVVQAFQTFTGPDMERTEREHQSHAGVLPPFLEHIHVMLDQFQHSELAQALFHKMGLQNVFKGFVGRDGKMDYDRLFESLENQSFRRRWIKNAIVYLADWANYLSNPEVYQRYIATGQIMANSFLKSQGYPDSAQLDIRRPSETIANVIDHTARRQLNVKVSSLEYVKPAVSYLRDLLKLGKARELLQKVNATEVSEKLTDSLNLEVIEPVLKVHRAYRFVVQNPKCDQYVLCELNSHDSKEDLGLGGFKAGVTKFGSMAAAWFMSSETKTPFWTLFATINDPHKCKKKFPVNCSGFHEGEVKVTTEYIHNEL